MKTAYVWENVTIAGIWRVAFDFDMLEPHSYENLKSAMIHAINTQAEKLALHLETDTWLEIDLLTSTKSIVVKTKEDLAGRLNYTSP